jgi:hypothetical protein
MTMKVLITEGQHKRIIELMKNFANEYSDERVIRTDIEIEYIPERGQYIIYPIFYVRNKEKFPHHIYKHILSQRLEDMFGVPVYSTSSRVKEI